MPKEVLQENQLVSMIKEFSEPILKEKQVIYIVGRIETKRLNRSSETDEYHRNYLKSRFGDK
jgi:hypothetical protein